MAATSDEASLPRVLRLGAADFVLLSLLAFVLLYILPRKLLALVRRTPVGSGPTAAAAAASDSSNVKGGALPKRD